MQSPPQEKRSDMNYEKTWNHLKDFIETITEASTDFAEAEYLDADERLRYEGRENMGRKILNFMAFSEKKDDHQR